MRREAVKKRNMERRRDVYGNRARMKQKEKRGGKGRGRKRERGQERKREGITREEKAGNEREREGKRGEGRKDEERRGEERRGEERGGEGSNRRLVLRAWQDWPVEPHTPSSCVHSCEKHMQRSVSNRFSQRLSH
jgi:hypothetical protein